MMAEATLGNLLSGFFLIIPTDHNIHKYQVFLTPSWFYFYEKKVLIWSWKFFITSPVLSLFAFYFDHNSGNRYVN